MGHRYIVQVLSEKLLEKARHRIGCLRVPNTRNVRRMLDILANDITIWPDVKEEIVEAALENIINSEEYQEREARKFSDDIMNLLL